ncbi:MAG: AEC family transporter [Neomegalonema sp.]|nr:AEC family transporter [Neomegalonema sp.]
MIFNVLEITAPAFFLAAVGYGWARSGAPYDIPFVTRLAMMWALPALIFSTLSRTPLEPTALREIALATVALYGAFALIFGIGFRAAGLQLRTFLPPSVFNNSGNIGLPIALFAFGEKGLALAIVLFAVMVALQFSIGLAYVAGPGRGWEAARQPMVWAALIGVGCSYFGLKPSGFLDKAIALLGQLGIPLMLLTLGVSISRIKVASVLRAAVVACVRFVAAGAIGVGIGIAFGLSGAVFSVLVLQAIMPAPITNYLLALKYDAEPEEVAGLVVVSTALSILFIPLTLALLLGAS